MFKKTLKYIHVVIRHILFFWGPKSLTWTDDSWKYWTQLVWALCGYPSRVLRLVGFHTDMAIGCQKKYVKALHLVVYHCAICWWVIGTLQWVVDSGRSSINTLFSDKSHVLMLLPPCHSGGVTHHVGNEQLWYRARIRALSVPGPWVLWYNVGPPNDSEVGEHNSNNYGFMILITYNYSIYRGDTPA